MPHKMFKMKKLFLIVFFVSFFIGPLLLLSAEKINFKKWLNEEVYWLITREEQTAFKNLKTDKDRGDFIALFWAKRDPTPSTEKNEFKEAYYANLAFVNQKYTRGQQMGWKTDIGKILLFFGLPSNRQTNPETWIYGPIPQLQIETGFRVVFDAVEGVGLVLNQQQTSRTALDAMDEYAYRTILYPDMKEAPDYRKPPASDPHAFEKEILERASTEGSEAQEIPFDTAVFFSKAKEGKTSLTLIYYFDPKEIGIERAVIFGKITSRAGKAQNYRREIRLKKDDYFGQVVFPLPPDGYEIVSVLKDASSEKYAVRKKDLVVPDFWKGELALGSLILSNRVEAIAPGSAESSAFNFGQYLVYPKKDYVFKKSDILNVAYQIYNAATLSGRVRLVQDIILKSSTQTYRLPEQPLEREVPEGQAVVFGFPIPLAQIEPGEYELLVKVADQISRQSVEKAKKVRIVD
jgi:GWxTD domain-containing protein